MNASDVRRRHRAALVSRIETLGAGAEAARQGTRVDGDHRPSSRGERGAVTSQAALQAGLASRSEEVRAALQLLDGLPVVERVRVGAGALVRIDEGGAASWVAVFPGGAGDVLDTPGGEVTVVSPTSPVARALSGLEEGDEAVLRLPGRVRLLEVLDVR
jgi:transcription elongation GreA/GreB family factor